MQVSLLSLCLLLLLKLSDATEVFIGDIPDSIKPLHYTIALRVDLSRWYYTGRTSVYFNLTEPAYQIPIHSNDLNVTAIHLLQGYDTFDILDVIVDTDYEFLRIYPEALLQPGIYRLIVDFNGTVSNKLWGFYRSTWVDEYGEEQRMASTYFSPDKARNMYPCFDEPRLKARFQFYIEHESKYEAISNTELIDRSVVMPGWVRSVFATTPPMSTYVTAMIVTNYRYRQAYSNSGVRCRVYGPPERLNHSMEELEILSSGVDFFEEYFNIEYTFNKLDLVVVYDFAVGAMENWGVITGQDYVVNYNRKMGDTFLEIYRRAVINHEVAHMWFGDLVTQTWWNDLWLKEGMASWLMMVATDAQFTDFDHSDDFFIHTNMIPGLQLDGYSSSHPIKSPVRTRYEVGSIFDGISYYKGSAVVRMLNHVVGEKAFRKGMNHYLTKYAYSNARHTDLVQAFQDALPEGVDIDVISLLDRFILQMNYPLVYVRLINSTHILVTQERFLYPNTNANESTVDESPYGYQWDVPFTYITDSHRSENVIILKDKVNILELPKRSKWIKANNHFRMYYRVQYDLVNWRQIYYQLIDDHNYFSASDRAQMIDDLFNLAAAKKLDISLPLLFCKYLKNERSYVPWKTALVHIGKIQGHLSPAERHTSKLYVRSIINDVLKEMTGFSSSIDNPVQMRLMQTMMVSAGLENDHKGALDFLDIQYGSNGTDPEVALLTKQRRVASDQAEWQTGYAKLFTKMENQEYANTIALLATRKNKTNLLQLLTISLNDSVIPREMRRDVLTRVSAADPTLAWQFFRQKYNAYFEVFGATQFHMTAIIESVLSQLDTVRAYNEAVEFFKDREVGTGGAGLTSGLSAIMENIRWRHTYRARCRAFFYSFARKTNNSKIKRA